MNDKMGAFYSVNYAERKPPFLSQLSKVFDIYGGNDTLILSNTFYILGEGMVEMDMAIVLFFVFLAICLLLIVMTLVTLPKLGDERKNFIKMKAQSYTFTVVVGIVLLEILESVYLTFKESSYEGMNPFAFLTAISVIYLSSLLISKRKYGG